jgi:myo-inositol 2-dehydrogenase/D-chiro-inositol 1-dehydrogenase
MDTFIECLQKKMPMPITGEDGLSAMLIALAANISVKENRVVKIEELLA